MSLHSLNEIPLTKGEEGTLTRRATLTFVSSLLQQAARFIVGFGVTPIVIRGLGAELYGVWVILQQTVGYLALSDLCPMGTLKFTLAVRQHIEDTAEKRRQIGSALIIWAITFPIFLAFGIGAVWAAPVFIRTSPEYIWAVRLTLALLVLSIALDRVLSLPANVLRGMNLDYKAMGLNAATILLGGLLTVLAVWGGWGLPGVAVAAIMGIVVSSGVRFLVARRVLPWFGIARPSRKELVDFAKLSAWLFFSALGGILLIASDLIVVGFILGPAAAAVYAITGSALRLIMGPLENLLSSGGPGIAEICGRGDWPRLEKVRNEMHVMALCGMAVIGAGVLSLNQVFLHLWVGDGFYGGNLLNLLLVLAAFEMLLFRVDSTIVDSMLEFRAKTFIILACGVVSLILGAILTWMWGLPGMALGVFLGRLGLFLYIPALIYRKGISIGKYLKSTRRTAIVALGLFILSYYLRQFIQPSTWVSLIITIILSGSLALGIILILGVNQNYRKVLIKRMGNLFPMFNNTLRS